MFTELKRRLAGAFKRQSAPPAADDNASKSSIAEYLARYDAAVAFHRKRFDEMAEANQVKEWFRSEINSFLAEWPRGEAPLQMAIKGARSSRFKGELEEFLTQMEAHWHAPTKNPSP